MGILYDTQVTLNSHGLSIDPEILDKQLIKIRSAVQLNESIDLLTYAYAIGYYQGRALGQEETSQSEEFGALALEYFKAGYMRGVTEYVVYDMKEEA